VHRIKKDAIFLIDGSYLLYRSYYGLRPLRTSKGIPTQATYGFCRAIKKIIDDFDPTKMALVWDSKGKTFRSEIYEAYKANRQAPPSDLFIQKEQIIEFADSIGLKQISKASYEADDLIGSITQDFKKKEIVIVGPDKDLYQLLSDTVLIFDPFKDQIIDPETLKKEKGFGPEKVSFFFSLLGDASDNIPGVKGIGKKTAEELVNSFDSLDDLYANLDKVKKDRTRKLLEESKENAFLSLKLFSLKHYKLDLEEEDFNFDKDDWANAAPIFMELEFKSLVKDVQKRFPQAVEEKIENKKEVQTSLFASNEEPKKDLKEKKWKCHIVRTQEELDKLFEVLKESKEFAFDTELTGLRPLDNELVGLSFAVNKKEAYYIPFGHKAEKEEKNLERELVLQTLKPIFENKKIEKIMQNAKFDQLALWHYEVETNNVTFDTLLAAHLLRKDEWERINLKALSLRYLDEPMQTFKDVVGKHKHFGLVSIEDAAEYGAHDSLQTFKLKSVLEKDLNKEKKLKKIFNDLEMPISQVLFEMESLGIALDPEKLREIGKEIEKDLNAVESEALKAIAEFRKHETTIINLSSPKQVEKLLFDELELPVIKKSGKGKRSTDQEVLSALSNQHPIPGMIAKYRELAKLKSTYVEPLIKEINPETGRIHTSFSQTMVATGRLSSSNPNLQNIPVGSDHGIKIRSAFVAPRGRIFLSADYSQVELRVLAHMTKDKNLVDAFLHDRDIHIQTASQLFDVPLTKVTHDQRQIGKRINFSIIYGLTPFGLSRDLGIKPSEAKVYIDKYFEQYQGVAKWMEKTIEDVKKDGYTQTWLGRRRYVPSIYEKNRNLYEAARRIAINTPVQGTSAEIMKLAMIEVNKELKDKKLNSGMILQIHDELVIELDKDDEAKVEKIVKKCMENVVKWEIPFKVTIRTGKNWGQITK